MKNSFGYQKLEIEISRRNPNYLLSTSLTRHWD